MQGSSGLAATREVSRVLDLIIAEGVRLLMMGLTSLRGRLTLSARVAGVLLRVGHRGEVQVAIYLEPGQLELKTLIS